MRILNMRPTPPGAAKRKLADFDVEIDENLRMYGLLVFETPDGRRRTVEPKSWDGHRVATFTPLLDELMTRAASHAIGGQQANGISVDV